MAAKPAPKFETISHAYARLWAEADIKPSWRPALEKAADRVLASRDRYEAVSKATGVPWFVIGILHMRESGNSFSKHLHEGSPLTGRTLWVPKGRPKTGNPPFTWEESAYDALVTLKKLNKVPAWTIERICYEVERYNGWGYRLYHGRTLSPYLWQGTDHYADEDSPAGKYVADGKYDPNEVDKQCGALGVLKVLIERDPSIRFDRVETAAERVARDPEQKIERNGVLALLAGAIYYVWDWLVFAFAWVVSLFGALPDISNSITETLSSGRNVATEIGIPFPTKLGVAIAATCFLIAIISRRMPKKV